MLKSFVIEAMTDIKKLRTCPPLQIRLTWRDRFFSLRK
jgi:hypothetical protein